MSKKDSKQKQEKTTAKKTTAKKQNKKLEEVVETKTPTKYRRAKMMFLVLFMLIIVVCTQITTIGIIAKYETSKLMSIDQVPLSKLKFSASGKEFNRITISAEYAFIKDKCEAGCNLEIAYNGKDYKFIVERNTKGVYYLSIVEGNKYLSYKENIGTTLRQSYFVEYNTYLTFVTVVKKENVEYDHVIIINENNEIDRFTSLQSDQIELTSDGIIYFYDVCVDNHSIVENGQLIEARRVPFSNDVEILSEPYVYFEWCEKEV